MSYPESLQNSKYEQTKLISTVIITLPAKEIKEEKGDKKIKTEQDWLKLPKNVPNENISINDPNVCPRLIHKDGTICHSKTYWASINKKPPLKEVKLPDPFSDNKEMETGLQTNKIDPVTSNSSHGADKCTDKGTLQIENNKVMVNTEKPDAKMPTQTRNAINDTPSTEHSLADTPPVNTEKPISEASVESSINETTTTDIPPFTLRNHVPSHQYQQKTHGRKNLS